MKGNCRPAEQRADSVCALRRRRFHPVAEMPPRNAAAPRAGGRRGSDGAARWRIVLARFQQEGRMRQVRKTIHDAGFWMVRRPSDGRIGSRFGQAASSRRRSDESRDGNRKPRLRNRDEAQWASALPIRRGLNSSRCVKEIAVGGIRLVVLFLRRRTCRGSDPSPAIGMEFARNLVRRT